MTQRKRKALAFVFAMALAGCIAAACTPSSGGDSSATQSVEYSDDSLIAYHEGIGQDITDISEVSYETCEPCHGDYEEIRAETEDMFEGIGQIPDANPHASHASNAYECSDCHSLTGTSMLMCNACHNFELPSGWVSKDAKTTIYGNEESAPYTGDGVVDATAE